MKIELHLKGYLTESPNSTRWAHWRVAYREKQEAARALMSALCAAQLGLSTPITSEDRLRQSSIASAIVALLPMIPKRLSRSTSAKRRLLAAKITKLSSR